MSLRPRGPRKGAPPLRVSVGFRVALALAGPVSAQTTLYVDAGATGPVHDGASWCSAFLTLDPALAAVTPGTTIRVADGVYKPNPDGLPNPREATFEVPNGVELLGGYAGCGAPAPDRRDVSAFETILSGDLNGDDAPDQANRTDNVYHVLTCEPSVSSASIDGFTITGGNATDIDPDHSIGGGLRMRGGLCEVRNCVFRENAAGHSEPDRLCCCIHPSAGCEPVSCESLVCAADPTCCSGPWDIHCVNLAGAHCGSLCFTPSTCYPDLTGGGGGLYVEDSSAPISDTRFESNHSNNFGGGVRILDADPTLTRCTFDQNFATDTGGGLASDGTSDPILQDCVWLENVAESWGGGAALGPTLAAVVSGCRFERNSASVGAGLALLGDPWTESSPAIMNSWFLSNSIMDTYGGGGLFASNANPWIFQCVFNANRGFAGGGIRVTTASIYFDSTPSIANCAFVGNYSLLGGGGIYNDGNTIVSNTIFWNNSDRDHGTGQAGQFHVVGDATPSVSYSIIHNRTGSAAWDIVGNLGSYPGFQDEDGPDNVIGTVDDDLTLQPAAAAIDRGTNAMVPSGDTLDLALSPRVADGDGDSSAIVDIGPYEFREEPAPIPCVSAWGLVSGTILLAISGTLLLRRSRTPLAVSPH